MNNLSDMIWIERRKAIRSRMPLWTALGSLFMPLGIAFLIFVSKNPEISQKLGLVSAKANLVAYSATDWPTYLGLFGLIIAAGGFFLFVLIISWVFGREFADGTLKDMLAVPVQRSSILLAKFIVVAVWSAALTQSLSWSSAWSWVRSSSSREARRTSFSRAALSSAITACLAIAVVLPFALFASVGRGYLLPIGLAVLTLMMTNLVAIARVGRILPLGRAGVICAGKKRPDADQLLDRVLDRPGRA